MKISTVTIAKLSEEKKAVPVIATGKAREQNAEKLTKRAAAIRAELLTFKDGTRKTSSEIIAKINGSAEYLRYGDAVTDREILNACKTLQAENIGIIGKQNKKGEYYYSRMNWESFVADGLALPVVTIEEQAKEQAERAAKVKARKEREIAEATDARLASMGISESEILALAARANTKTA